MIRIGIDARLLHYRPRGGTSTYIRALGAALASAPEPSQTVTVFQHFRDREPAVPGLTHRALFTPCHHRWERSALSLELARHRLDVFHSPDFIPPHRGARRHVITIHDLAFLIYPETLTADSRRYYNAQIHAAARHADHILAVSESTKRDIIERLNMGSHKITVQPHGVDPAFRPASAEAVAAMRARFGLPETYLLFVSTFEPRKNIDALLTAYEDLRALLPDAPPLVMVGTPGWLIDATLARMQRTPGVIIRQDVDHAALPAVYSGAAALVMPAFYEGFGMPVLEAMACGTLPIVSDVSSLPEIAGDVGLRVDPHRPESITHALLLALTMDSDWQAGQRQAALERAAGFTWTRSAAIARQVYEAVA
jgi:glycosyltransferase involved in cell wall biosynthesis